MLPNAELPGGVSVKMPGRYFSGLQSAEHLLDGPAAGPVRDRGVE
jgi:hypothetical protein